MGECPPIVGLTDGADRLSDRRSFVGVDGAEGIDVPE